jgi:predicted amidohydrolase
MTFTIGLAQCKHPANDDVVADARRWAEQAHAACVDLLVFPEAFMTKFDGSLERFIQQAQPANGPFSQAIDALAAEYSLWIAYTINERAPDGGLPYNTAVISDDAGMQQARYRKVHLFDAQGHRESDRMSAGDALMAPVRAPFATIGLGICYDLRFPEVALHAALDGAQLMIYPSAWVDGPGKIMQWKTLLAARAIENGMFVAGVCSADANRIGHSCVFAPDGTLLAEADADAELLTCEIDLDEVSRVRAATPSLTHRRNDCYS